MKKIQLRYLLFLLLCICATNLQAQDSRLKKANELFDKYSFLEAAEAYKKILAKTDIAEAKIKLAECYRSLNMPVESEYWYEQIVDLPESDALHKYHYGMALKMNGKFEEAKQMFLEYAQLVPADTRGLRQVEACEQTNYFLTDPGIYQIALAGNINNSLSNFSPVFYKEGIIYATETEKGKAYNWTGNSFLDLYYAEGSEDDPCALGTPEEFNTKVNSDYHEGTAAFTNDFNTMYFARNNFLDGKLACDEEDKTRKIDGTVKLKIYEAKMEGEKWVDFKELPFNSDAYSCAHPTLAPDGQALYFVSDMPGGYGDMDIYVSYKSGDSWGTPENLGPEINTEGREMFPYMAPDGILYFSSDALPGLGGLDLFSAQLLDDGTWSAPENLRYPINTNADDFGLIVDEENEKGYFSSNRSGGAGSDDIYCFTKVTNILSGEVIHCIEKEPIEDALVKLQIEDQIMQKVKTSPEGTFSFPVSPDQDYTLIVSKLGFEEALQEVSTTDMPGVINIRIPICPPAPVVDTTDTTTTQPPVKPNELTGGEEPEPPVDIFCYVSGRVYDNTSNTPIAGAIVKLTNSATREEKTVLTEEDGTFEFELEPESNYVIYATKDYYFSSTETISTVGRDCSDPLQKDLPFIDVGVKKIPVNTEKEVTKVIDTVYITQEKIVEKEKIVYRDNPNPPPPAYTPPTEPKTIIKYVEKECPKTYPVIGDVGFDSHGNKSHSFLPTIHHIYYDFDEHFIREDAKPELDKVMRFMNENPGLIIELGSHTDARGKKQYNQELSQKRAQSAVDYLVSRGIMRDRLMPKGYGESQLTNGCTDGVKCSETKHQENRRTEFTLIGYNPSWGNHSLPRYFFQNDPNAPSHKGKGKKNYFKDYFSDSSEKNADYGIGTATSTYSSGSSTANQGYGVSSGTYYGDGTSTSGTSSYSSGSSYTSGGSTSSGSVGGVQYGVGGTYTGSSSSSSSSGSSTGGTYYDSEEGSYDYDSNSNSSSGSDTYNNYDSGSGSDTYNNYDSGSSGSDTYDSGSGSDTYNNYDSGSGSDTYNNYDSGSSGSDTYDSGSGSDTYNNYDSGSGSDTYDNDTDSSDDEGGFYSSSTSTSTSTYSGGSNYDSGTSYGTYYDNNKTLGTSVYEGTDRIANPACCGLPTEHVNNNPSYSTEYKVQLGTYSNVDMSQFNGLNDLGFVTTETTASGTSRVILGPFENRNAAEEAMNNVRSRGFGEADVVKYQNGLRVAR